MFVYRELDEALGLTEVAGDVFPRQPYQQERMVAEQNSFHLWPDRPTITPS